MAITIQYYHQFYDLGGILHRIEILKDAPLLNTPILYSGDDPIQLQHNGGDKDSWDETIIQGTSLSFKFYSAREDIAEYDALFTAIYQTYQIKYYVNSVLEFIGWLKPENFSRDFTINPPYIEINLVATDGLKELQDIDFMVGTSLDVVPIANFTILEILKYALRPLNLSLDFYIQLNTYEANYGSAITCTLKDISVNGNQFYIIGEDNIIDSKSCYEVIESVLQIFNVTFKQFKGRYQITNYHELDSYQFVFDWATLTQQSRIATDNIIDISDYTYHTNIELQKIEPLSSLKITFPNEDIGESLTEELTDDTIETWEDHWDIVFPHYGILSDGEGNTTPWLDLRAEYPGWPGSMYLGTKNTMTLKDPFYIVKVTNDDYILLTFDYRLVSNPNLPSNVISGGAEFWLMIDIQHPNGLWRNAGKVILPERDLSTFSYNSMPYGIMFEGAAFNVRETGNYKIRFRFVYEYEDSWFQQWGNYTFQLSNISINGVFDWQSPIQEKENKKVLKKFLAVTKYQNTAKSYKTKEIDISFGDGVLTSQLGTLLYFQVIPYNEYIPTESWNTYLNTEDCLLVELYVVNILSNRAEYKSYFPKITIIDRERTLNINSIVLIDSKYYVFQNWTYSERLGEFSCSLIELLLKQEETESFSSIVGDTQIIKTLPPTSITENLGDIIPTPIQFQPDHGFVPLDVLRYDITTSSYVKAQADTIEHAQVIGIVSDVLTDSTFKIAIGTELIPKIVSAQLTVGKEYYLSSITPGLMVEEPDGEIVQNLGIGIPGGFKAASITSSADLTRNSEDIPAEAIAQEVIEASNVNKYIPPQLIKVLKVQCWNDFRDDLPEYVFPTGVAYDDRVLDDAKIIEPN